MSHPFSRFALCLPFAFGPLACAPAAVQAPPVAPPPAAPAPAPVAPSPTPEVTTTSAAIPVVAPPAAVEGPPAAACVPEDDSGDTKSAACFPSESYRSWLCDQSGVGTAVTLFRKGSPWVRAYVARDLDSWDPSRRHAQAAHLSLDEEVIVLHPNKPSGSVVVVGATNARGWQSVEAVRANGACVSLMADEITMTRPPTPKHAPLAWEKLDDHTRAAWLASKEVRKKVGLMTKACAGGDGPPCAKAKARLTDAVVATPE